MVFTGHPSKACERCRKQRKKCDLGRPQCRKCINANVECPGYRDERDLMFRNVTDEVVDKHSVKRRRSARRKDAESSPPNRSDASPPLVHLRDGVLEVALAFLFRCYLRGSSFEWAQDLYSRSAGHTLFEEVVRATALAAYSFESHRESLLAQARVTYDHALLRLREELDLSSPITDFTLASILLMSRFETLLNDGSRTSVSENWAGHVSGAMSIVQSRTDEENFADPLSYLLSEQTVHNYNLYCVQQSRRRSEALITATEKLKQWGAGSKEAPLLECRLQLHDLSDGFIRCRKDLLKADASYLQSAISNGLAVEKQLIRFADTLAALAPVEVRPATELCDGDFGTDFPPHAKQVHVYRNHHDMRMWNNVRMLRLALHVDIVEQTARVRSSFSPGDEEYLDFDPDPQVQQSVAVIQDNSAAICASAPQFLRSGLPDCTHAAGCYLAWPLYVAGRTDRANCRDFVADALMWIAKELRIKSAQLAALSLDDVRYQDDSLMAVHLF